MWEHKLKNRLLKTAARRLDDFFIFFLIAAGKGNEMFVILSKRYNNTDLHFETFFFDV